MLLIISPKAVYAATRLKAEAQKYGQAAEILDLKDLAARRFRISPRKYSCLYVRQAYPYLEEVFRLAQKFARAGKRVCDANLVEQGFSMSKFDATQKLYRAQCRVLPATRIKNLSGIKYPAMLKWQFGFGGKEAFAVRNLQELQAVIKRYPLDEWFCEPLVNAQYEYKVITVGYKSLPVILRYDYDSSRHRPNMQKFKVLFTRQAAPMVKAGEIAAKILGRELAKIDVLSTGKNFYILEVNRTPGLRSFEIGTKYNVAGEFVKYLSRPARDNLALRA